jgi:hypothetical protein
MEKDELCKKSNQISLIDFKYLRLMCNKMNNNTENKVNCSVNILNTTTLSQRTRDVNNATSDELSIYNEEYEIIYRFYTRMINEQFHHRYWRVAATAITFFHKFYICNNILLYDPRIVMLASVLLAGKVEHHYIGIEELLTLNPSTTNDIICKYETFILQSLDFKLFVYHPNNIMNTILSDMRHIYTNAILIDKDKEKDCVDMLLSLQLSHISFMYNPLIICLFCIKYSSKHQIDIDKYIVERYGQDLFQELSSEYSSIEMIYEKSKVEIDGGAIKQYLKRLKTSNLWNQIV